MHVLRSLLTIAALASAVVAAPARPRREGRSFKVTRVRRDDYVAHGPSALWKAYRKHRLHHPHPPLLSGAPATATLVNNAVATATSGGDQEAEVTASPEQNDVEFLSPVEIGGQTLMLDFDTGSSDLWVFNTQLKSSASSGHTIYDSSKSSTFKTFEGATFSVSYGDGSFAKGNVGLDTVNIGGATVANQAFGLPTSVSQSFTEDTQSNGLVGLAFKSINTISPEQQNTFFENVVGTLDEPVLTANLRHDTPGSYEFGKIDTTQFQGDLQFAAVDSSQGFWQFTSTSFAVGGGDAQTIADGSGAAIADTGTSLMLVDDDVAQTYYASVSGASLSQTQGGFVFPCTADLPDLAISVGDFLATVPGSLINFASTGETVDGEASCFGGVQSSAGSPFQIFGDVFLKANFVAFNLGNSSLGVAPHA